MARLLALFEIDLRALAAFRIGLAITSIYALVILAPDLGAFYSDAGLAPRDMGAAGEGVTGERPAAHLRTGALSILSLSGGVWLVWLVWAAGMLASFALLAGWRGRWAAAALWLVWLSLIGRNAMVIQGGDRLMVLLLFWAMMLPVSARMSVDHALTPDEKRGADSVVSIAAAGLLLQVLYVYVFGALLKTAGPWWPNGSAIYIALHLDTFATVAGAAVRGLGGALQALTYFVFFIELLAPVFLFWPDARRRVRQGALALLIAMHVGFRVFLHIGHFWMVSLSSLMVYAPGVWWDALERRWWRPDQRRIEIWYDRDCGFCLKVALLLREAFLPRATPVRPAQDHAEYGPLLARETSWVVVDGAGRRLLHWDAVAFVMRQNPILRPLGWLAWLYGAAGLGRRTYDLIGDSRGGLGRVSRLLTPPARLVFAPSRALGAGLAVVIAAAFLWNLSHSLPAARALFPPGAEWAFRAIGQEQRWGMFAPSPPLRDGYPVIRVAGAEGAAAENLFLKPPSAAPVGAWRDQFPSHRWRKYVNNLRVSTPEIRAPYLTRWAAHACRVAGRRGAAPAAIHIRMVERETRGDYTRRPLEEDWGRHPCPAPPPKPGG